jgi:DNA-binding NarL/FixJ family response regulator
MCGHPVDRALSSRQLQAIQLTIEGYTERDMAEAMGICLRTAKQHLYMAFDRLGIATIESHARIRLAVYWNCELFQVGLKDLGIVA